MRCCIGIRTIHRNILHRRAGSHGHHSHSGRSIDRPGSTSRCFHHGDLRDGRSHPRTPGDDVDPGVPTCWTADLRTVGQSELSKRVGDDNEGDESGLTASNASDWDLPDQRVIEVPMYQIGNESCREMIRKMQLMRDVQMNLMWPATAKGEIVFEGLEGMLKEQ